VLVVDVDSPAYAIGDEVTGKEPDN